MSLKGRLPWIVAGLAFAIALLAWESYRAELEKSAGVPEAVAKLADKVESLEADMKNITKALADAIASMAPDSEGKLPPANPVLAQAIAKGIRLVPESCLWKLSEAVKDCRNKGFADEADRAEIERIRKECH